jgi:hypothetical protein
MREVEIEVREADLRAAVAEIGRAPTTLAASRFICFEGA